LPLLLLTLPVLAQAAYNCTTNNGAITITGYTGPDAAVTIPSTIDGLPVTSIGNSAFSGANLTSVTLPDTVTNIGDYAFGGCCGLASIAIGNGVTSIGRSALNACHSLTSLTIPNSVANIGSEAFFNCWNLTTVTIGNRVASIGLGAFGYCPNLNSLYFQGNAPSVGPAVFQGDNATVYYLPGTTGWGPILAGLPTVLWNPQVGSNNAGFGVRANQFGFTIAGTANIVVVVEASTELANSAWSPLVTNTLAGGSFYFSDPLWTNYPARFYRLRWP
jgi:hypothetical protein